MKKLLLLSTVIALFATAASATGSLSVLDSTGATQTLSTGVDGSNQVYNFGSSAAITNPTNTLTLPATTTAYAAGNQVGAPTSSNFFTIPNTAGGFYLPRLRLSTNDSTTTAWGGAIVQVDLWTAFPTLSGGDRTAFVVSVGNQTHLGAYTCTFSAEGGDGAYAECAPNVGTTPAIRLASGTSVFWTLQASSVSGVTGASRAFTLTAELAN